MVFRFWLVMAEAKLGKRWISHGRWSGLEIHKLPETNSTVICMWKCD